MINKLLELKKQGGKVRFPSNYVRQTSTTEKLPTENEEREYKIDYESFADFSVEPSYKYRGLNILLELPVLIKEDGKEEEKITFRNVSIIRDGRPVVNELEVCVDNNVKKIKVEIEEVNKLSELEFGNKLVNSIKELDRYTMERKAIKAVIDDKLTPEQKEKRKDNVFFERTKSKQEGPSYEVSSLDVYLKGYSSLKSMNAVLKDEENKKNINPLYKHTMEKYLEFGEIEDLDKLFEIDKEIKENINKNKEELFRLSLQKTFTEWGNTVIDGVNIRVKTETVYR